MIDDTGKRAVCACCGHELMGVYCSHCGEQVLDPSKLTLRYFLTHTVAEELLSFDGKIWRTLRALLFRPGYLALEYAAGRRRSYVNPIRVLLVAIIAYVLATQSGIGFTLGSGALRLSQAPAPMSPQRSIEATLDQIDRFGVLQNLFTKRFGAPASASSELSSRFNASLNGFATPLSFTTVVLIGGVLYGFFHRRRPLFVEHLVFSMQFYSFVLLGLLLAVLLVRLHAPFSFTIATLLSISIWQFAYLAFAIRNFYFESVRRRSIAWLFSSALAIFVGVLNSLFITAVQFAGGAVAIARL